MKENRVRYDKYGSALLPGDPRQEPVPTKPGGKQQYLHWRAARAFQRLHKEALAEGLDLRLASGCRTPRFATEEEYNAFVTKRYGSVAKGRKYLAYKSAHFVCLAADFGTEGLEPKSSTIAKQRKTAAYAWLEKNAERFGFTPYMLEPWHWEYNISFDDWEDTPPTWRTPAGIVAGLAAAAGAAYWLLRGRK